jgi:hypothetical protein
VVELGYDFAVRATRIGIAALVSGASACTLFVDVKGLSGGAQPIEAGSGGEGGAGAIVGGDAGLLPDGDRADRFCATLPPSSGFRFCADFDGPNEDGGAASEWPTQSLANGGVLSLDLEHFASAPHALRAASTSGDSVFVNGVAPPPRTVMKAEFDFAYLANSTTPDEAVCVFALQQLSTDYHGVLLYRQDGNVYAQTTGAPGNSQFSTKIPAPALGTWHHGTLVVDQKAGTISATYDDQTLWDHLANAFPFSGTTEISFMAGLPELWRGGSADVAVDNIVVEVE